MLLTHILNNQKISKKVNHETTLLAANNLGGYLWLGDNANQSRYQGWYVQLKGEVYKILDEIKINSQKEIRELINIWAKDTNYLQRIYKNTAETYYMPKIQNALVYELSQIREINLILDIRKSYSSPQQERHYDIYEKGDFIIIKYNDKELKEPLFLAIFTPSLKTWKKTEKWVKKEGIFDKKRNSPPYFFYVYHILTLRTDRLFMEVGLSEKDAISFLCHSKNLSVPACRQTGLAENVSVAKNLYFVFGRTFVFSCHSERSEESQVLHSLARQSLKNLLVYNKDGKILGIYAGLPWFFQFWLRDEAISLKALFQINKKIADEILKKRSLSISRSFAVAQDDTLSIARSPFLSLRGLPADRQGAAATKQSLLRGRRLLRFARNDKEKSVIARNEVTKQSQTINTLDGLQWTIYRFLEEIQDVNKDLTVNIEKISQIIRYIVDYHANKDGLIVNNSSPTWMDSIQRSQFPVEMQALQLSIYNLAHKATGEKKYKLLEKTLLKKTREHFWTGEYLKDGKDDETIRPNIFLSYYIYPKLLTKKEWTRCFDCALKHLWLDWGGLSTIDKKNSLFVGNHTGETPSSYHRGDSWFWINNIAAICMLRLDKKKFSFKIKKIFQSSTKDLLWYDAIGHSSELSSAQKFIPAGSISQAWSSATYLELFEALKRTQNFFGII